MQQMTLSLYALHSAELLSFRYELKFCIFDNLDKVQTLNGCVC